MKLKRNFFIALVAVITLGLTGNVYGQCEYSSKDKHREHASNDAECSKDIVDTAVNAGSFNTLVAAVKAAGLVDTLKSKGPFTVFAPTNSAFAKLPKATLAKALKNKHMLTKILTYHVVAGKVLAKDVVKLRSVKTVSGAKVSIRVSDNGVMINNARVIKTDILCKNGVIHIIDNVLIPECTREKDIVETAMKAGKFNTLVTAVKAAGLVDTLKGKGPFTVFAPTDAAFAKLPKATLAAVLKNKQLLTSILTYHVVSGKVMAKTAITLKSAKTVNGQSFTLEIKNGKLIIDGKAQVIATDIKCKNGVIHVIDAVILPVKK